MEHPLINDATNLSMEDLHERMRDLQRKLAWAQRTNSYLAHQITMALETYTNQYQQRQQEIWQKKQGDSPDFSDRIDIS